MGEWSPSPSSHYHHHLNSSFNSDFMAGVGCLQDQYGGDDLFGTYIDLDKIPLLETSEGSGRQYKHPQKEKQQHQRYNSYSSAPTDWSGRSGRELVLEAKKAMPPDKLAELWTIDPKRAKRILANRQSAARSKERKARYIAELEQKLRALQTEATTLSAQLSLFQRDTTGLTTENNELKLQVQSMEQQAQLHDALSEALMQEVEKLKIATGEKTSNPNLPEPLSFATPNHVPTSYTFSPYNPAMTRTTTSQHQTSTPPPPPHHHQLTQYCHTEQGILGLAQHDSVASHPAECMPADDDDPLSQLQQQQHGVGLICRIGAATQASFSATESSTTS